MLKAKLQAFNSFISTLKTGEYRYAHSKEILMMPQRSKLPIPRQPKRMLIKDRIAKVNAISKTKGKHEQLIRENPEEDPYIISKQLPRYIPASWKPRPKTLKEARLEAILDYNKAKMPPITPDLFMIDSTEETEAQRVQNEAEEYEYFRSILEEEFDFGSFGVDYQTSLYGQPILSLIFDFFNIFQPPEPVRYYAVDWKEYGSYHYPKRTYFKTIEEKEQYRQIQDWTMPNFEIRSLFLPNGKLNFDYQPPPWEIPVPVALGLPHLDIKIKGIRMLDVYRLFCFEKESITLLDVHRQFVKTIRANGALSPYMRTIIANARARAEYNLRGPKKEIVWHDWKMNWRVLKKIVNRLFFRNNPVPTFAHYNELSELRKESLKQHKKLVKSLHKYGYFDSPLRKAIKRFFSLPKAKGLGFRVKTM